MKNQSNQQKPHCCTIKAYRDKKAEVINALNGEDSGKVFVAGSKFSPSVCLESVHLKKGDKLIVTHKIKISGGNEIHEKICDISE